MVRPVVALLSVEIITDAALAMVEQTGSFTMPRVAKSLGVTVSSLYNHVSGREELIEHMRGRALALNPFDPGDVEGWEEVVLGVLRAMRRSYASMPALVPLLFAQTISHPAVLEMYNGLATRFSEVGFADDELVPLISMLDSFAFGAALDTVAPTEVWRLPAGEGGELSTLERAVAASEPRGRAEQSFEFGCRLLIDGLRVRMAAADPAAGPASGPAAGPAAGPRDAG